MPTTSEHGRIAHPWRHVLLFLLIAGMVGVGYCRRQGKNPEQEAAARHYTESFMVMGTIARVQFWEQDRADSKAAAATVRTVFDEINDRFSTYNPESELSRLNASAAEAPFACSPEMWDLFRESRDAYVYTNGAFDISAGPLIKLWGLYRRERESLPTAVELTAARARVGLDKVIFDDEQKTVMFSVPGMYLDVGGIAKGYAVDQAAGRLRQRGIRMGVIDLGGNIYCFPEAPPGRPDYYIQVRHPRSPLAKMKSVGRVSLRRMAIATSGDYERYVEIDGKRYTHIVDPRTGRPVHGRISVTVLARRATVTDALSTGIFVNGTAGLEDLRRRFPELNVLIIRESDEGALSMQKFSGTDNLWGGIRPVSEWDR